MSANEIDPYQPPQTDIGTGEDLDGGTLAGRGQRIAAAIIDGLISMLYAFPIMYYIGTWDYVTRGARPPTNILLEAAIIGFIAFILIHGYFLYNTGQTLGKKIMGVRIATLDGEVPKLWKVTFLRYLPMQAAGVLPPLYQMLSLIDVLFIFRSDKRCIHDFIAGTQVLKVSKKT